MQFIFTRVALLFDHLSNRCTFAAVIFPKPSLLYRRVADRASRLFHICAHCLAAPASDEAPLCARARVCLRLTIGSICFLWSGTHDVHALILGRAITGLQAFTADRWCAVLYWSPTVASSEVYRRPSPGRTALADDSSFPWIRHQSGLQRPLPAASDCWLHEPIDTRWVAKIWHDWHLCGAWQRNCVWCSRLVWA